MAFVSTKSRITGWVSAILGSVVLAPGIAAAADECVPTDPSTAQQAVEDARRAVLTLEFESTINKLEEVRRSLPCLTGPVQSETLALLYFYQGVLYFNLGNTTGAADAFRDAAGVDPLLLEEREHGTQIRELWAASRDDVTKRTTVLVMPNLPSTAIAYVDGKQIDVKLQAVTVYPGVHLVQVVGDDARLKGTLMRTRSSETTLMPAELLAELTPRGEIVLDILPRRSHVVVRQGNFVVYDIPKSERRTTIGDVKQGAYIVEVNRTGFYPGTQAKVAVEGKNLTEVQVNLVRKPSFSINPRYGLFWVSGERQDTDPMFGVEMVGRASNGWGIHVEYVQHIQDDRFGPAAEPDDGAVYQDPNPDDNQYVCTIDYTVNENFAQEEDGDYLNGPPCYPYVTTVNLPIGARIYLGATKNFRIEGANLAIGPKAAMDIFHGSALMEFSAAWEPFPWIGLNARAGVGVMVHVSDYIYDKMEEDAMSDYIRAGGIGMVNIGGKVGF